MNKDAEISVVWVNSWYDPVKESDAAKVLIAEGADILAQHTDSPAMLQTAEKLVRLVLANHQTCMNLHQPTAVLICE